jgi:hypothetical protein
MIALAALQTDLLRCKETISLLAVTGSRLSVLVETLGVKPGGRGSTHTCTARGPGQSQ